MAKAKPSSSNTRRKTTNKEIKEEHPQRKYQTRYQINIEYPKSLSTYFPFSRQEAVEGIISAESQGFNCVLLREGIYLEYRTPK